jgi:hypothetical protein
MDTSIVRYDLCMHHAYAGKQYGCTGSMYTDVNWLEPDEPKPTVEELNAIWEEIKEAEALKEVHMNRQMAYPMPTELVVAMWEKLVEQDGLTSDAIADIQARRQAVKTNFPK